MRNEIGQFSLELSPDTLSEARARFAELVEQLALDADTTHHVLIAVEEAVQNIVVHGYKPDEWPGRLDISVWRDDGDLVFELRDYAAPVDIAAIKPRVLGPAQRPGGLGLHLIRAAMDDVRYSHAPNGSGNILLMRKRLG